MLVYAQLVPWRYPPVRELQFGEWQREDIEAGIYEPAQLDADIAILLTKARHASVALVGDQAARLYPPVPPRDLRQTFQDTLALWRETADLQGDERNIILTLARIWYSVVSGDITGKEEAAAWLLPQLPAEHAILLVFGDDNIAVFIHLTVNLLPWRIPVQQRLQNLINNASHGVP